MPTFTPLPQIVIVSDTTLKLMRALDDGAIVVTQLDGGPTEATIYTDDTGSTVLSSFGLTAITSGRIAGFVETGHNYSIDSSDIDDPIFPYFFPAVDGPGSVGPEGPDGPPGTGIELVGRGDWVPAINYAVNDIVSYRNASYVCIVAHLSTSTFEGGRWLKLAGPGMTCLAYDESGTPFTSTTTTTAAPAEILSVTFTAGDNPIKFEFSCGALSSDTIAEVPQIQIMENSVQVGIMLAKMAAANCGGPASQSRQRTLTPGDDYTYTVLANVITTGHGLSIFAPYSIGIYET